MKRILMILIVGTACHPLEELKKEIRGYGYIPFQTPLKQAGPGTLVSGQPETLGLVVAPETCFPKTFEGKSTLMHQEDHTSLGKRSHHVSISARAKVDLMKFMNSGNGGGIRMGTQIDHLKNIHIELSGVTIEYLDSVYVTQFYRNHMSSHCKAYLEQVGFIIQAIRVSKMIFKFEQEGGLLVDLNTKKLSDYIDIDAGLQYKLKDRFTLEIDSPKYIGFQLGRLMASSGGLVLYRSSQVRYSRFFYEPIDHFKQKTIAQKNYD